MLPQINLEFPLTPHYCRKMYPVQNPDQHYQVQEQAALKMAKLQVKQQGVKT